MNTRSVSIFALLLLAMLASDAVWAREDTSLPSVSAEMTQEEYAAYRARIREQMEATQQADGNDEAEEKATQRKPRNGYGQGYRARQERARGDGMMGRGAGRNR